jgi:hypothetical protein
MAYPVDARQRRLTRQFPGEDIWKLIEQQRIRDVADWLREEIASRNWDYETAERVLDTDRAHLCRTIHGRNRLSQYKVMLFAVRFGHVFDDAGNVTTDKIEYLMARFGYGGVRNAR